MKKNIIIVSLFFVLSCGLSVLTAFAQQAAIDPVTAFRNPAVVKAPDAAMFMAAKTVPATDQGRVKKTPVAAMTNELLRDLLTNAKGGGVPPGENRVFNVHQDREFLTRGQEINLSLIGAGNWTGPLSIVGVIFEPDDSGRCGEQCRMTYFSPELAGDGGFLPNGFNFGQMYANMFSKKMGLSDKPGEYVVSMLAFDYGGNLVQQTFNYFYLNVSGPQGLFSWRTDEAIQTTFGSFQVLLLKGRYPVNRPIWITIGKATRDLPQTQYYVASPDGVTILLQRPYLWYRAVEYDVTILDNIYRVTHTKVAAITLPAETSN